MHNVLFQDILEVNNISHSFIHYRKKNCRLIIHYFCQSQSNMIVEIITTQLSFQRIFCAIHVTFVLDNHISYSRSWNYTHENSDKGQTKIWQQKVQLFHGSPNEPNVIARIPSISLYGIALFQFSPENSKSIQLWSETTWQAHGDQEI